MKIVISIIFAMTLAGCATTTPTTPSAVAPLAAGSVRHTVMPGETLYGISRMYGVDLNALVRTNSLDEAGTIQKGQSLVIPIAPSRTRKEFVPTYSADKDSFVWPVRGPVISLFGAKVGKVRNKGIDILIANGAAVHSSRAGKVVYCDSSLRGFGKTVILYHGDGYETVYAYNSDILVKTGDVVGQNAVIAKAGKTGRTKEPTLHFEIRKNSRPQNPAYYLPH